MSETFYNTGTAAAYFSALNATQTKTYHYKVLSLGTAQNSTAAPISALFSSSDLAAIGETDFRYDANHKARNICGLATDTRVIDPATNLVKAKSHVEYDEAIYALSSTGTLPTAAANSWVTLLTKLGTTVGTKRRLPIRF